MNIDLSSFPITNKTVAIALSGGGDSMALLHYMLSQTKIYHFSIIAINIEHGIRGESSISDTNFVIEHCNKHGIPLLTYSIDCKKYASENKLSLEQAGRILRYQIFYQAIEQKKCDLVATAHHLNDNFESVLFNLFRGTALKGLCGIDQNFENKIIRPFLSVSKSQIEEYLQENAIPFVTDQTNFCTDYTRNDIRLNIIPKIEQIFPDAQNCVYRFSQTAKIENDYMQEQTLKAITFDKDSVKVILPLHPALLGRATILALKHLGVKKDWEKTHIDSVNQLANGQNGNKAYLKNGIIAIKEYDRITFVKQLTTSLEEIAFSQGKHQFNGQILAIEPTQTNNFKNGFYCDGDKIPKGSVIRTRRDNDKFTKFGGGTKSLSDYFTDKKIPLSERDSLPLIAFENQVLAIFDIAISQTIKVDSSTKTILKLTKEN